MSPMLSIQLLGEFCLLADDRPVHALNRPRQQALLAYLLLHRRAPQPRQRLAFTFWPDSTEGQAHTNLRKLYFQLRQALPDAERYLLADTREIGWRHEATYKLDVDELEHLLEALEQGATPVAATVQRVCALYAGDLLPDFYDEWLLPLRRALKERVVRALEQALTALEAQREYQVGLRTAEHLLRLDPLHEATYRHLMHFRALAGDRAGALKLYYECVDVLAEELGVPPAAETQAHYQKLLAGETQPPPQAYLTQGPAQRHVPLVGRMAEWQVLRHALNERIQRGPHLFMVWSEAGVGKTRLAEEVMHGARLRPGSVAYARAYGAEGAMTYAPIIEWLRSGALRPQLARLDTLWRTELARLLPELLIEEPTLPTPAPMTEGWQQLRFYEAIARAVLAMPAPCLLVLDDLQWCDGETIAWLRFLLRFDPQAPLLVIGTARNEALDPQHPLHSLRQQLQRAGQWSELTLTPLTAPETAVLAGHLAQEDVEVWAATLYRETGGNPLFVVEMVRAGYAAAVQNSQTVVLPQTVQAVIEERLSRLTPEAFHLAQLAAAIGRRFSVEELAEASGFDEEMLVTGLDELWQRRIVRAQGAGYDFCHDKIRDVAYRQASAPRRRSLHQHVGSALAKIYTGRADEIAGELAVHAEQAGHTRQAIDLLMRAARVEQLMCAYAEASTRLRRALLLLPSLPMARAEALQQELALLAPLGVCMLTLRGYGDREVAAVYQRAHDICTQLADDPQIMPILVGLALFYMVEGDLNRALAIGQQSLELAQRMGDGGLLVEAYALVGPILQYQGAFQASIASLEQGLALYNPGRDRAHAHVYGQEPGVVLRALLAISLWQAGYPDRSLASMRQAIALAQEAEHPYSLILAQSFAAHLHHLRREPAALEVAAAEGAGLAHKHGIRYWLVICTMFRGWSAVQRAAQAGQPGQNASEATALLEASLAQIQAGFEAFKQTGAGLFRCYYMSLIAEAQSAAGAQAAAMETIAGALAIAATAQDRFWLAELHRLRGEFLLAQAQTRPAEPETEAERLFLCALQTARAQQARMLEARAALSLARLWQRQGQRAKARALLKPICDWFIEGHDTPDLQAAHALLAELE